MFPKKESLILAKFMTFIPSGRYAQLVGDKYKLAFLSGILLVDIVVVLSWVFMESGTGSLVGSALSGSATNSI